MILCSVPDDKFRQEPQLHAAAGRASQAHSTPITANLGNIVRSHAAQNMAVAEFEHPVNRTNFFKVCETGARGCWGSHWRERIERFEHAISREDSA